MSMRKMALLGIAAVSLVGAAPARAGLTMSGDCGVISVPDTNVLPPMTLSVAADYVNTEDALVPLRLEVGVIEGLEVGVSYWWWDASGVDYILGGNAKYQLPLDLAEGFKVAAGGRYQRTATDGDDANGYAVYGVASYAVELEGVTLTGSAGVDWERVSNGGSESGLGFFAALDVAIGLVEGLSVAGEFASENGDLGNDTAGLVVRYALPMVPGVALQAGVTDFGPGDDHEFFLGAQFTFGAM